MTSADPKGWLAKSVVRRVCVTIRDRVVQTAAKLVLEPIFEADFEDSAYGYRPIRGAVDAVKEVHRLIGRGYTDVVDADLSKYLDDASYYTPACAV